MTIKRTRSDSVKYIPHIWIFSSISTSKREIPYRLTSLLLRHFSWGFFPPTANMYQSCIKITDQIHSKTESCLQHVSCSAGLRDVKWRLRISYFKGSPYPKRESSLPELLHAGSAANCRGLPSSPPYGRAASSFCREGGLQTPDCWSAF